MKTKLMLVCLILAGVLLGCTVTEDGYLILRTVDPRYNLVVELNQPSLLPTITPNPEVIPAEEVGELEPDPTPVPPCDLIKGNISSSGEKIYHLPTGAYYGQVKIDESRGEEFFCSEEEAVDAGFRPSSR